MSRRGWKVAWWGSVEKKENSHFFRLRGSLHKLDHVSRTLREDWTTEDALSGSGEEDQIISIQGGMSTPRKILGDVINKQDEEDWTKYRALGDHSSDAEGKAAGTINLDFSSTVRKQGAYRKNEARGQEEFMKQSRVPDTTYPGESRPGKWRRDDRGIKFATRPVLLLCAWGRYHVEQSAYQSTLFFGSRCFVLACFWETFKWGDPCEIFLKIRNYNFTKRYLNFVLNLVILQTFN